MSRIFHFVIENDTEMRQMSQAVPFRYKIVTALKKMREIRGLFEGSNCSQ